jgi:hypothetical protein
MRCIHCANLIKNHELDWFDKTGQGIIRLGKFVWCNLDCYIRFKGFAS